MATQQQQAPPPEAQRVLETSDLSIAEMTRIMDVASTLRRERAVAERELSIGDTKRLLRERLIETARVTGDPVTEAEIDAAIEHYFQHLHKFDPPEWSFETFMAHVYVLRWKLAAWAAFLGGGAAVVWGVFG